MKKIIWILIILAGCGLFIFLGTADLRKMFGSDDTQVATQSDTTTTAAPTTTTTTSVAPATTTLPPTTTPAPLQTPTPLPTTIAESGSPAPSPDPSPTQPMATATPSASPTAATSTDTGPTLPVADASTYPYSILLGTYNDFEKAKRGQKYFSDQGLPAYLVKVIFGPNNIIYRIFCGTFASEAEARDYRQANAIGSKAIKETRFAALIGAYTSSADVEQMQQQLVARGYYSYIIPAAPDRQYLYVGAYLTEAGARDMCADLKTKGINCTAVERSNLASLETTSPQTQRLLPQSRPQQQQRPRVAPIRFCWAPSTAVPRLKSGVSSINHATSSPIGSRSTWAPTGYSTACSAVISRPVTRPPILSATRI